MKPILFLFALAATLQTAAQTFTKTLRPKNGADCQIMMLDSTNINWGAMAYYKHVIDSNRYTTGLGEMNMMAWTYSGCPGLVRGVIRFTDIKNTAVIPANANITSAILTFYSVDSSTNWGNSVFPGSPYGLPNDGWLYQLSDTFNEHTVTWRTQPGIMHNDSVHISGTSSRYGGIYVLDVTSMVQDMHANINTGFEMRLDSEYYYRANLIAASTHTDSTKHPKLVITYTVPAGVEKINENGMSVSLYPNPAAQAQIYLDVNSGRNDVVDIKVYDATGRKLLNEQRNVRQGYNKVTLPVYNLAKGIYFLEVTNGAGIYRSSFSRL